MKLTFLGTGTSQGIPVIGCECEVCRSIDFRDKRLRTSALIEVEGKNIVIDSGPDFRQQMLVNRVNRLDALLFTHEHKDHTAGMDDIRSFNFLQKKDMPIYADERVLNQLKQEFAYVFAESKYPGVPRVQTHEIENKPFEIEGINVIPIEVMHYKLPIYGYRIGDLTYITDAKTIKDEEKEKIRGTKVLVLNALQQTEHISHLTLEEAINLSEELKSEHTYLTHLSHKMGKQKEVEKLLPPNITIAHDGLSIQV